MREAMIRRTRGVRRERDQDATGVGWRRRVTTALTVTLLAASGLTSLAVTGAEPAAAAETPWTCDAYGYLFQSPNGVNVAPHTFTRIDLATGEAAGTVDTEAEVNGVGYNVLDDYFYGYSTAYDAIVRISADGSFTNLGRPSGIPSGTFNIGDFDDQGHLWLSVNGTSYTYFEIDYAPGSATYGTVLSTGTLALPSGVRLNPDWAWIDGALYGMGGTSPVATNALLLKIDTDGTVTNLGPWLDTDGEIVGPVSTAGAVYADAAGYLYASSNDTGEIHRIDPTTREAILVGMGPASGGNDGARCSAAAIPTITVTKDVEGRYAAEDQFTVALENADGTVLTSATTTGTTTSATTTDWPVTQGSTYTITDAMAADSSSTMANYSAYASCVTGDGTDVVLAGTGPTWSLTVDDPTAYDCTVTNTAVTAPLSVVKTSDASPSTRIGDTVTYSVTATNHGTAAYTDENPAIIADSLVGVLDDASYNDDAEASVAGDLQYAEPLVSWRGALGAGESVTLTYSVTLTAGGDRSVRNVAWQPGTDDVEAPACDVTDGTGVDSSTGEPCATSTFDLPSLTISKVADRSDLPADGESITYTVTVTNDSDADFTDAAPATASDDLSHVLDDGALDGDASASTGTVTLDSAASTLAWSGVLRAGEVATITYTVVYDAQKSGGDHVLTNTACVPADLASGDTCSSVRVPAGALVQKKTVDPSSGSPVSSGQDVTYTLTFTNEGTTAATVDTIDDLSGVLDDAEITDGPTSSDSSLTAQITGDELAVTGTVPAGQTYTVTYTVTVKEFASQGDHALANVLGGDACVTDDTSCRTENPVRHLRVDKSADPEAGVRTGDVITYTVTVHNDGTGDYTDADPASVIDDLSQVLDDASLDEESVTATAGDVTYDEPTLTWTGALAAGETATITYAVAVTNRGDHALTNTASAVCSSPEICDPAVVVEIELPHITATKSADPADSTVVEAGDVVTYTLSWTNDGRASGAVDSTDDLANLLDDADVTSEPVSSDPDNVVATLTDSTIRVVGDIDPGATVTVTYQVTVKADGDHGDNVMDNVLVPDAAEYCTDDELCPSPSTSHPVGELASWKSVDPASGATVRSGAVLTYTLHFANVGQGAVDVVRVDGLSGVLDDATVTSSPVASSDDLVVSEIADGRFSVTGSLATGAAATVTYAVTVNADGERGDDNLGNFLLAEGEEPPADGVCVPRDEQHPDCTANAVSNITVEKTSDPASGTAVLGGDRITYTLTFTNVGTNPAAAAVAVDQVDHLAGVLDDAELVSGPTSSDEALTATVDDDTIHIVGSVATGATVTVTYAVQVVDYAAGGDHVVANVIAAAGTEPVCVADSLLCTTNDVTPPADVETPGEEPQSEPGESTPPAVIDAGGEEPPAASDAVTPPSLAITGLQVGGTVAAAVLFLIAGGAVLLIARRRKTRES